MKILLKSAIIVDPGNTRHHLKKRDILISNGILERIAAKIPEEKKLEVVSLDNLHVSAGWIDTSVCFGEPGYEERETIAHGLLVAAKGGFTDIVLNTNTLPVPDSSGDIIFLKNAASDSGARLHPLGALTVRGEGNQLAELFDMSGSGAVGFYDYKQPIANAHLFKIALQYARTFNGLVHSFPMDTDLAGRGMINESEVSTSLGLKGIPALAETTRIARDLAILEYTGGRLHIPTISAAGAVQLISEARKQGLDVSCSVAIHNLWFSDEQLKEFESNFKVLPPLRSKKDQKALIKGIKDGVIDFVTSDHTPMAVEDKRVEFDNAAFGSIGLESIFGILNRIFDMTTAVGLLTKGRSRYGIPDHGIIEGQPADLTLFDPDLEYTLLDRDLLSTSGNSMFLGERLKGRAYGIFTNNRLVIDNQSSN